VTSIYSEEADNNIVSARRLKRAAMSSVYNWSRRVESADDVAISWSPTSVAAQNVERRQQCSGSSLQREQLLPRPVCTHFIRQPHVLLLPPRSSLYCCVFRSCFVICLSFDILYDYASQYL